MKVFLRAGRSVFSYFTALHCMYILHLDIQCEHKSADLQLVQ